MSTQTPKYINQNKRVLINDDKKNPTDNTPLDNAQSDTKTDTKNISRNLTTNNDKNLFQNAVTSSINTNIGRLRSGIQGNHDEIARHMGKNYWQNGSVVKPQDNSEKLGSHYCETNPKPSKKRRSKQDKSDVECFASHTFKSFNRDVLKNYESRNPQPKEWKREERS
jgi:hypothetical protein